MVPRKKQDKKFSSSVQTVRSMEKVEWAKVYRVPNVVCCRHAECAFTKGCSFGICLMTSANVEEHRVL